MLKCYALKNECDVSNKAAGITTEIELFIHFISVTSAFKMNSEMDYLIIHCHLGF